MSGASKLDYISNAIEYFSKILLLCKCLEKRRKDVKEFIESFDTRAKNGPQMIRDQGIIPYLAFLASKSGENLVVRIYDLLKVDEIKCEALERLDKAAGYAAYFNAIVTYLEKLGIIQVSNKLSVIGIIQTLFENIHGYRAVEPLLMRYLVELKKLSSAYFSGHRG